MDRGGAQGTRGAHPADLLRALAGAEDEPPQLEPLRLILGSLADGVSVQDRSGRLLYANDAAARSCGLASADEMLRMAPGDIFERFEVLDEHGLPVDAGRLPGRVIFAGGIPEPLLLQVRERATGRTWWTEVRAAAVRDERGVPQLAVNVWHDVTEQRRRELETRFLSEASAILASGLDYAETLDQVARLAVPIMADWSAVYLIEDGELRGVAFAHVDQAKVELARELNRRWPPPLDAPHGAALTARTGASQILAEISDETLVRGARSPEHLDILRRLQLRSAITVPLLARGASIGALTLVWAESNRRYTERDLPVAEELGRRAGLAVDNARLYREAQQAVRVRDLFLSVAGHELRTPLTALTLQIGGIRRLLERGAGDEGVAKLRERIDKMAGHCARVERLVSDLLDVSRITASRLTLMREEVALDQLVMEVLERFGDALAAAGCELRVDLEHVIGAWDRLRIDQVVTNLVANAIKYGKGSPIDVTVARRDDDAVLEVADHGIGIAAADQQRIFDRFERAVSERHFGGLGLGLWITREVVEAHGGAIEVVSREGEGARFAVRLPRAAPA